MFPLDSTRTFLILGQWRHRNGTKYIRILCFRYHICKTLIIICRLFNYIILIYKAYGRKIIVEVRRWRGSWRFGEFVENPFGKKKTMFGPKNSGLLSQNILYFIHSVVEIYKRIQVHIYVVYVYIILLFIIYYLCKMTYSDNICI